MPASLFDRRVRIVSGKGGVGKSCVAWAMAITAARSGKRVLLCEVNAKESMTRLLGQPALTGTIREVLPNLDMVALVPKEALREYALMTLRFKTLYNAVFENKLVSYFLQAVPSLSEFVMLGKLWYHEQQKQPGSTQPLYDLIVVDAPATGHLISWLRVPQVFVEMMPAGPLKKSGEDIRLMLANRSFLDVVATPEEMPVNEALHIRAETERLQFCSLGISILNRVLEPLPPRLLVSLPAFPEPVKPLATIIQRRDHWQKLGVAYAAKLPANSLRLPQQPLPIADLAGIKHFALAFESALAELTP